MKIRNATNRISIKRSAVSAAVLGSVLAMSLAPSYQAQAAELAPSLDSKAAQSLQQKQRYVYASFGEALDTKYARDEAEVAALAKEACESNGFEYVTPELLMSMAYQESKFVESAENGTARGMCQIKGEFHKAEMEAVGATDLMRAADSLATCGAILEVKAAEYAARGMDTARCVAAAVMHYHLNQGTAEGLVKEGRTDGYTDAVLERAGKISVAKIAEEADRSAGVLIDSEEDHDI